MNLSTYSFKIGYISGVHINQTYIIAKKHEGYMPAPAIYFTISTIEVAATVGSALAGPALIEGAALLGIRALSGNQGAVAKVAKYALGVIAVVSAFCLTIAFASTALFGFLVSVAAATTGSSLPPMASYLAISIGAATGLATLPFHGRAVQWSGLFPRKERPILNQV